MSSCSQSILSSKTGENISPSISEEIQPGKFMMGSKDRMMGMHHAQVPGDYAGLSNPKPSDQASVENGGIIYETQCATCHGDYGNGDGPGGIGLDPSPAPIAHTSTMLSDSYLYWRISEGGSEFGTSMIAFKGTLTDLELWDVINYVRTLSSGQIAPKEIVGGEMFSQEQELITRAEMLFNAIEDGVISYAESETFDLVHRAIDEYLLEESISGIAMNEDQTDGLKIILGALENGGTISHDQSSAFLIIHERLLDSGLMH